MKEARQEGNRDGDESTAHHNAEENGDDVVEGANLTRGKTKGLQDGLHTVAHVHEEAADGDDVECRAPRISESSLDVVVAVGRIAVEGELPQVECQEAQNHDTSKDHCAGGKGGLERTFLLVVGTGVVVLVLEHQSEHNVNQGNSQETKADSPEQPCGHGVQPGGIVINPGSATAACATTVDGHIAGQVTHQEQEKTRTRERHKNFAANRGRDEFACCGDNIVHMRNNVFAGLLYLIWVQKASTNRLERAKMLNSRRWE